jgi:Carboxypeptidase regulatory-like domain
MNEVVRSVAHVLRSNVRYLWVLCLLLAGLPFLAAAQEATIVGTVTDPAGSVVPNVTITVTNTGTGYVRTFTTNDVGQYVAPSLPIGKYDLRAESSGFKIEESKGVVLNVNDRTRVDFQMKMGTKSETVSVEANTIQVQADSSEQSSLISGTQISQLATNGRSIYTYVTLTTGASNLMPDFQPPTPVGANSNISFNGNRPGHNLYLLDGGENSDRGGAGGSSVMPSVDAIAETQTLTSNYTADYGLSSGGTVSSAIKSGTKAFHASAWEFFRNDALDARNFFNRAPAPVAELRYNVFGFNVGGPVTFGKLYNPNRTKTFFFYNMEWRRMIQGQTLNQTVPVASTYGGDFSAVAPTLDKLHAPFSCQLSPGIQAQFAAAGQALSGCTAGAPDTTKEVAFNGNAIPAALLDPNAQSLLHAGGKYGGIFPAPTSGTQFQGGNNVPTNVREEVVRIDENVNDKFTIYGHFVAEQIAQNYGTTMWSGDNVPTVSNTFGNPSYAGVVHTAYVISPTLVNEASFNYNGNRIAILPLGLVSAPADFNFNRFFTGPNVDNRIPSINLNGGTGSQYTANWTPWNNVADDYQIRDDVSWTKGRHQLKMGGSWALYKKVQDWFKNTQGNFNFNGSYTGNDFADYLLGYGQQYTEDAVKSSGHWNNVSWALYIQDNYRVNSRLTLNLGLRWDGIPHTYEANNQMSNFYPNLYNPANAAVLNPGQQTISTLSPGLGPSPNPILAGQQFYLNGIGICNVGGIPHGCVNNSWANFGPRLGFAYDVRGDGKTVIRGGYGIMYERIQGNDVYGNAGTVPFSASTSFNNVSLSDPKTSIATGLTIPATIPVNNITGLNKNNYTSPRSTQFSLGVQQAIGKSVLSVSYVGSQNRHQSYYTETDLPLQSSLAALQADSGPYNSLVPYLGYHGIKMAQNEANGDYNSLQVAMRGTLKTDLTYQLGYTYSHTNDAFNNNNCQAGGDLCVISNPYVGWKYDFGPSSYDRRQIFFANFVYQIPLLKNSDNKLLKTTLGGWEVAGIISAQSGAPLALGLNGQNVSSIVPNTFNRPDVTGSGGNPHTVNEWFNTSIYSAPAAGTWGNAPNNSVRGPGRDNWNLSLYKNFVFSQERGSSLQFRAEFFNVWNHTQFQGDNNNGGISKNLGASNFGAVTNAYDPRVIQLALKLFF